MSIGLGFPLYSALATAKDVAPVKRQRKPNYSAQENLFIPERYEEFKEIQGYDYQLEEK